jgi:vacuolar-type H+-ATPase subunit H
MTGEIIQSILEVEKKAEKIVADAHSVAQNLTLETEKKIKQLYDQFKEEKKTLLQTSKTEIDKKAEQKGQKVTEKCAKVIAELNEIASRNATSVKKFVLEKLIS